MTNLESNKRISGAVRGAQFGLAVTLFAFLAACGHKPIENGAVDETPVAANEIVPTPDSESTPVPGTEDALASSDQTTPVASAAPVARKAKHRVARHHRAHKRKMIAHNRRGHKASKKAAAAAVGQIARPQTPSGPQAPEAIAPTPVIPAPTTLGALAQTNAPVLEDAGPAYRSWWIWSAVIGASLALLVIFRAGSGRRSRRLQFNS